MSEPSIDYLGRDYRGLRRVMLDRLAQLVPEQGAHDPAELSTTLVEILAYAGDQLSIFQDAVATEAYIGTARRRVSVRRHARLMGYTMHEGCNARVFAQLQLAADSPEAAPSEGVLVPRGTTLLTRVPGARGRLHPGTSELERAQTRAPALFETLHAALLHPEHAAIAIAVPDGAPTYALEPGATSATLVGELSRLRPGDLLLLEERRDPESGLPELADPERRHVVRLREVSVTPARGQTTVTWAFADALPFRLVVADTAGLETHTDMARASANLMLADHGRTLAPSSLPPLRRSRVGLPEPGLVHAESYDHDQARELSAHATLAQDPRRALPCVRLVDSHHGITWLPRRELVVADRSAAVFVVETESDRRSSARFGDGHTGRRPPADALFSAHVRVGGGPRGNIGWGSLAHVVSDDPRISGVSNPLPARGGLAPEALERARIHAPQASRHQQRAVTPEDYARLTAGHTEVARAAARLRWTGLKNAVDITVERHGRAPIDPGFVAKLLAFLEPFRLVGHQLHVVAPRYLPVEIALTVHVTPGVARARVRAALIERLRLFFTPEAFSFGEPLYLSRLVVAVMEVPGVQWIDTEDAPERSYFRVVDSPSAREAGVIRPGPLEILTLDRPVEALSLFMEGGR